MNPPIMPSDQAAGPAVETAGPVEDWRRAVGSLREAAKWIVVAFAGVGAAILGVLPVVGVSKLDTAPSIGLAVAGALLAVAGVAIGVWATSDVLTPHVSTLKSVGARPDVVAAVNDDPATYLGAAGVTVDAFAEDLSGWQRTLRELREQRGPDTHAEKLRQDALGIARLNVENRAVIARQVVAFGHFQLVRALFRRARIIMFWAFAMVALGVGLFVAGTVVASGDNGDSGGTVANLGYPASIRLAFSDEGRKQLGDRLSAACMRQPVPAYLFSGDWVVTAQGGGCRPVAFRWTSDLGTIRLP
jgi:hypothetical protein